MEDHPKGQGSAVTQNTSHAVMSQRIEPADSLDDFPTPPWATRAFLKHFFMFPSIMSVWEPACGRGHMVKALREYFGIVRASDIHDYGYGDTIDFLGTPKASSCDWLITNPLQPNLESLIERIEKATGPDRELDAMICAAAAPLCRADYVLGASPSANRVGMVTRYFDDGGHGTFVADRYTASLDAALTLVPEGMPWCVTADNKISGERLQPSSHVLCKGSNFISAATPALALCAASLRARSHTDGEKGE